MKRSGLALMVLMMLIGLLPVIATEPADATMENRELFGSILSDSDDRIRSLTVVDGTAYFLTQRAFYSYSLGQSEVNYVCKATGLYDERDGFPPAVGMLFEDSGQLLGFNPISGQLYRMQIKNSSVLFTELARFDMSLLVRGDPPYEYVQEAERGVLQGDYLYLKIPSFHNSTNDLYRLDLNNMEVMALGLTQLSSLSSYKEGNLIGLRTQNTSVSQGRDNKAESIWELAWVDTTSGVVHSLPASLPQDDITSNTAIFYNEADDTITLVTASHIYRLEEEAKR